MLRGKRMLSVVIIACLLFATASAVVANSGIGSSATNNWTIAELTALKGVVDTAISTTSRAELQAYLEDASDQAAAVLAMTTIDDEVGLATKGALEYAAKLAADAEQAPGRWDGTPFIVYTVPALSPEKRLPTTLPTDGAIGDELKIISAQNEYEASSFVMAPLADVSEVTFTASALAGDTATIPASAVDIRVVKTWYQGGTAWQSYFFDDTLDVLTPELLLYDETLVISDHVSKRNYLRVDYPTGSQYVDMSGSPPASFSSYTEPVADSSVLLPVELKQGESKQMWVTTKVPAGTPEGLYTGTIAIEADGLPAGAIEVIIRVLPFELPAPKTYYDLDKDFYTMMYHNSRLKDALTETGNNVALSEARLLNHYRNLVEHNVINLPTNANINLNEPHIFLRQLELMEEAGMDLNPLFGVGPAFTSNEHYSIWTQYLSAKAAYEADPTPANEAIMNTRFAAYWATLEPAKAYIEEAFDIVSTALGHTNLYFDAWDEAEWNRLLWQQELWRYIKEDIGAKIFATGHENHLDLPITEDFLSWFGDPARTKSGAWHNLGNDKIITNYAHPHSGPENPDLMRQRHGMWLYKANYDAVYNYIWYFESPYVNPWGDYVDATYRSFGFVYPTQTDVIDTLAWEGFREGIDDIRYATKLKMVAEDALASADPARIAAANKALDWLEDTDERSISSDLLRLEIIYYIMKLLDLE